MIKRYAIIEIGTKGIRLLVADASEVGIDKIIYSTGEKSNLGKEADLHGKLSEDSIDRVLYFCKEYYKIAKSKGANNILAIATEIVRVAPNRSTLEKLISSIMPFKLLTRENEASFSFLAAVDAFKENISSDSILLVIDQGGGSTEIAIGQILRNGTSSFDNFISLKLGTASLSKLLINAKNLKRGFEEVRIEIESKLQSNLINSFSLPKNLPIYAVGMGSSIMDFGKILIYEKTNRKVNINQLHGYSIDTSVMGKYIDRIQPSLANYPKQGSELDSDNDLVTFISGIVVYHEIAKFYKVIDIKLNRQGMRFGALLWQAGKNVTTKSVNPIKNNYSSTLNNPEEFINLNEATHDQLIALPHIGPILADKIIAYRTMNGRFCSIEDLIKVNGLGDNTLNAIRDYLRIS